MVWRHVAHERFGKIMDKSKFQNAIPIERGIVRGRKPRNERSLKRVLRNRFRQLDRNSAIDPASPF
jgi:hypothetical protein